MAEMTVRRWQERFRAGDFNSRDLSVQCEAGWYDWFCRDEALAGRLKKLSSVVMGIQAPFILDNYYVWFKNNCPVAGPLYDDARFEPLSGERNGKYFIVSLDSPHEQAKWVLYTERYGYDAPEFGSGNVRDVVRYINSMAAELEHNAQPDFLLEKQAVSDYIFRHEWKRNIPIYREGEHKFSYISRKDRKPRKVTVTCSLEDLPSGYTAEQAEQHGKLYVFGMEQPMASLRDDDGKREVMSNGKGQYFVVECCRDQKQLQSIQRRIQNQIRGLDATAGKVRVRIHVLEHLKAHLMPGKQRKAG